MDYKKVIQQIIDNPANTLTTTSKDLLETMATSIELDLEQAKNCSIPNVVGRSEQLGDTDYCNSCHKNVPKGFCNSFNCRWSKA